MKIWTCRNSQRIGPRNAWTWIKHFNVARRLSKCWKFFGAIWMIYCGVWWPLTKPGYIIMTPRQSNSQLSGGIVVRLEFLGSIRHPPHWLSSKGPNYQRGVVLISAGANEGYFEGKTPRWRSPRGSCSCTTMPRLTGHLQPTRNWTTWASSFLITHPILQIWHCWTTTCPLGWRNNWKVPILCLIRRSLLQQRPGWTDNLLNFFWVACKS